MEVLFMRSNEYKKYQSILAINIKKFRGEKSLSQEKLGLLADVDRTLVSKIERCIANPSLEILVKISLCLEVPIDQLLKM